MVSAMRQCRQGRPSFEHSVSDMVMPFDRNVVAENEVPFHTERGLVRCPQAWHLGGRFALDITRKHRAWSRQGCSGLDAAGTANVAKLAPPPPAQPENRAVWKLTRA